MNYAASFHSSSDNEDSGDSSEDNEVDETLVRELRESLHFCVGNICRAEELAASKEVGRENESDNDSNDYGMTTTSSTTKKTETVMTKEAIAALTELVYHYSTSSLANDLHAFSNHANRRTVKADDVLLVARKEKHILAELKRKLVADQPVGESSSNNRRGDSTTSTAAGRKTKKNTNKNNTRTNSCKNPLFNSGKKKTAKSKSTMFDSSSSSNSSSSSDSDSDVDPMERIRQRRLELKQKNLNNTAFGRANNNNDDKDDSSSSSSDGLELNIGKSKTNGTNKKKRSNSPKRTVDSQDDMVIDLQDSD